jgi:ribose 5-phosphate isomerase B
MAKIYLACDHAGFHLKETFVEHLALLGHEVEDCGAFEHNVDDDYPDFVTPLAKRIANSADAVGIIFAGSGQGEAMCANRVPGVRAAVFYGEVSANDVLNKEGGHSEDGYDIVRLSRRHNNANVLSIGARFVSVNEATEAVKLFLETSFSKDARHIRRIEKF